MNRAGSMLLVLVFVLQISPIATGAESGKHARYFFPDDEIVRVRISPKGRWVVASARKGSTYGLFVQRFGEAEIQKIVASRSSIEAIDFVGDDTLVARFAPSQGRNFLRVDFVAGESGGFEFSREWFNPPGYLVDSLPLVDGTVLWGFDHDKRSRVKRIGLERLNERSVTRILRSRSSKNGDEVAIVAGVTHGWIVDRNDVPIVAKRRDESGYTILYRDSEDDEFSPIATFEDYSPNFIWPHGLSPDGRNLVVTAYNGGETVGLFLFDPRTQEFLEEISRKPDADIAEVLIDSVTRDVLSVTYEIGGQTHHDYLESSKELYTDQLGPDDPPIAELRIVSSTADRQKFIYWRTGPAEPGAHYLRSAPTNETVLVGQRAAHILRERLVVPDSFHVESIDGTSVELFLTRPLESAIQPTPLVVFPHGGPIGVRDKPEYDPIVQYLASWGFAILQVNYRGSSGYGRSFQEAGKKQWAMGIEDDIDAAVEFAGSQSDIDATRICIIGGSYGGFSAIASVLRHPGRYRCAVTINGVSDIPLMGESSDIADSPRVREAFESLVGDFETERERLLEISPAYHLRDVETPIQIVYGDDDRRVDSDHGVRVAMMLWLYGKQYEEIKVEGAGHSFTPSQWVDVGPHIRAFLTKHLMFPADPENKAP